MGRIEWFHGLHKVGVFFFLKGFLCFCFLLSVLCQVCCTFYAHVFLCFPQFRQKIIKERALPEIENYMFENHDQLRQAATECMCNLVVNKEVLILSVTPSSRHPVVLTFRCHRNDSWGTPIFLLYNTKTRGTH